jgi:hypothetical protein
MATAPQGGLGQASAAQPKPPAPQSGGNKAPSFDVDTAAAEHFEKQSETPAQDYASRALEERRKQSELLNSQIEMLKKNLEARMTPRFDPMLLKISAGLLRPTKTGSFGESVGYAAEGAAEESEKEIARNAQIDKMKMELMEKQQGLNQQNLIADYHASRLGILPQGAKPSGAPAGMPSSAPSGAPSGAPSIAPSAGGAPSKQPTGAVPSALQFRSGEMPQSAPAGRVGPTGGAMEMRPITDRDIAEANFIDPTGKLAKDLAEQAKLQREDIIMIDGRPYLKSQRQFLEGNPDTIVERNFGRYVGTLKVPLWLAKQYDVVKNEARAKNNPELVFEFLRENDLLEPSSQKDASGKPVYKSAEERKQEDEINQERLKAQIAEEKGSITMLESNARLARDTVNISKDIRATAESNPRAFDLLNNPGIADAVKRAAERGITAGSLGNFSIPARELESYKLSPEDRQALQLMAQKMSQLTVQFRKSARAPGEGATTESEGRLYAELGALPSDTAAVIRLKMEALEEKAKFDQAVFKAWAKFSGNKGATYRGFLASGYEEGSDLNNIMESYDARLERMRRANADLFRTSSKPSEIPPKTAAPSPAAQTKPSAQPASQAPKGETYSERLKRLQGKSGG